MHPRNRFRAGYDFRALIESSPGLAAFVGPNAYGNESIDYANPKAVKALNQALLKNAYGLQTWDVPPGYLCPPIPGRSDYLHYIADLLGGGKEAAIPRGGAVMVLDIGMGANCVYPLIGASEYGWRFVGSEVDPVALRWAEKLAASNRFVAGLIECRRQSAAMECFKDVIRPGEQFDLSMCNPPFHASAAEAAAGNRRKRRNLGTSGPGSSALNFGGQARELWCPGGERAFVLRMITQSVAVRDQCRWFTTLVSKSAHLPRFHRALKEVKAAEVRTIEMAQGQKQSRILAWTFLGADEQRAQAATRKKRVLANGGGGGLLFRGHHDSEGEGRHANFIHRAQQLGGVDALIGLEIAGVDGDLPGGALRHHAVQPLESPRLTRPGQFRHALAGVFAHAAAQVTDLGFEPEVPDTAKLHLGGHHAFVPKRAVDGHEVDLIDILHVDVEPPPVVRRGPGDLGLFLGLEAALADAHGRLLQPGKGLKRFLHVVEAPGAAEVIDAQGERGLGRHFHLVRPEVAIEGEVDAHADAQPGDGHGEDLRAGGEFDFADHGGELPTSTSNGR